jgi:hypothetical protein
MKEALDYQKSYGKEITNWIKTNLGVNLELVHGLIDSKLKSELKKQEESLKKREESLWMIFSNS